MTPELELQRAGRAEQILGDDLFKEAVSSIEEALLLGIRQTAFKDAELREVLCQRYALLQDLISQIRTHIETGKLAEATMKQKTILQRLRPANW